jgi:membrane protein
MTARDRKPPDLWALLLDPVDPRTRFGTVWHVFINAIQICTRYRAGGLAAEAAFFALLSLPPLIYAGVGAIGFITAQISPNVISDFRDELLEGASRILTQDVVDSVIEPTIDEVLQGGRADVISIGFLIALWSGSRALNVSIEAVAIMYGQAGHRNVVSRRAIAFALYLLFMLGAVVVFPLVLAGPDLVHRLLPDQLEWLGQLYWPIVLLGSAFFIAALYDVSLPRTFRMVQGLPGAGLALLIWVVGSVVLRWALGLTTNSPSIFGPLAAPIALMLWLYVISIAILVGASLNAAIRRTRTESALRSNL